MMERLEAMQIKLQQMIRVILGLVIKMTRQMKKRTERKEGTKMAHLGIETMRRRLIDLDQTEKMIGWDLKRKDVIEVEARMAINDKDAAGVAVRTGVFFFLIYLSFFIFFFFLFVLSFFFSCYSFISFFLFGLYCIACCRKFASGNTVAETDTARYGYLISYLYIDRSLIRYRTFSLQFKSQPTNTLGVAIISHINTIKKPGSFFDIKQTILTEPRKMPEQILVCTSKLPLSWSHCIF